MTLKDQACIAGVGETAYTRGSGQTVLRLVLEASRHAIDDAGLQVQAIDGFVLPGYFVYQEAMATNLGIEHLSYAAMIQMGGRVRLRPCKARPWRLPRAWPATCWCLLAGMAIRKRGGAGVSVRMRRSHRAKTPWVRQCGITAPRTALWPRCSITPGWQRATGSSTAQRIKKWTWERSGGKGKVFSWTIIYRALHPGFADELPYAVVLVELGEGVRIVSHVVHLPMRDLRIGLPVEVVFDDVTPDITLPKFRPLLA